MRGKGIDRILFHSNSREASRREASKREGVTDETIFAIWIAMFLIMASLAVIL
jgi:hypothetical protein